MPWPEVLGARYTARVTQMNDALSQLAREGPGKRRLMREVMTPNAILSLSRLGLAASLALLLAACSGGEDSAATRNNSGAEAETQAVSPPSPKTLGFADLGELPDGDLPAGVYSMIPVNYPGSNSDTEGLRLATRQANCGTPTLIASGNVLGAGMKREDGIAIAQLGKCGRDGGTLSCRKAGWNSQGTVKLDEGDARPRYDLKVMPDGTTPVFCQLGATDIAECSALYQCPAEVADMQMTNFQGTLQSFIETPPEMME